MPTRSDGLGPHLVGSLKAGPLWFVAGRQDGYVHDGGWHGAGHAMHRPGKLEGAVMIVEVASRSTVVMKPAAAARSYFRFLDGFGPGVGYKLPAGDTGFTFVACPHGPAGPNGQVTAFYLGFSIEAGRAAPVEVWPSAVPRPIRVIFTCRAADASSERRGRGFSIELLTRDGWPWLPGKPGKLP